MRRAAAAIVLLAGCGFPEGVRGDYGFAGYVSSVRPFDPTGESILVGDDPEPRWIVAVRVEYVLKGNPPSDADGMVRYAVRHPESFLGVSPARAIARRARFYGVPLSGDPPRHEVSVRGD